MNKINDFNVIFPLPEYEKHFSSIEIKLNDNIPTNLQEKKWLYVVYNNDEIIYIGQSNNLKRRLKNLINAINDWKAPHSGWKKIYQKKKNKKISANNIKIKVFILNATTEIKEKTAQDLIKYLEAQAIFKNREIHPLLND